MHRVIRTAIVIVLAAILSSLPVGCSGSESPTELLIPLLSSTRTGTAPPEPTNTLTIKPTTTPTPLPYDGPVKIFGHVVDEVGDPVEIPVALDAFGIGDQGWVMSDSNGYYEKQVKGAVQYIVSLNPGPAKQIGRYSFPAGYLPQRTLVVRNGPEAQVDFVVRVGGILWLKAYNESGREMATQDFVDASKVGAYPVGTFPYGETIQEKYGGLPLFGGWIQHSNKNIACLPLPSGDPADIWVLWRLPEVGTTFLHADNDGKGFSVEKGDVLSINLVYEFARTEYREAFLQYQELQGAGFIFSSDIGNGLDIAKQHLSHAEDDQAKGIEASSAVHSYKVLANVVKAREQLVLERARQDIAQCRMGDAVIDLVDEQGKALANASVEYKQVSHDFFFSAGWPSPQQYESLRAAGIEYSFFEAWWGEVETNDGVYAFPDSALAMQEQAGLGYIMKTGLWLTPNYPPAIPKFVAMMSPTELSSQAYQFSYDYVSHYKGRISMYSVLGEPEFPQAFQFTLDELIDITESSNLGVRRADPNLPTYVLIAHPMFKSLLMPEVSYSVIHDQFGRILPDAFSFPSPTRSGYEFLVALEKAGVALDAVGLEYAFGAPYPSIDLGLFEDSLAFYGKLNKQVFVDEIFYPTMMEYPSIDPWWESYGGWHEGFTDTTQADWAEATLTIAFSKPYVNGYDWSTTNDGPPGYYITGTGLFSKDNVTPRPVLSAIGNLIRSWTTEGTGVTDEKGSLAFRGYGGDYELTATTQDGRVFHSRIHVTEGRDNALRVTVDTSPPVLRSTYAMRSVVKNGDEVDIGADAGEDNLTIAADVSRLDTTKTEPIILHQEPDGTYKASFAISLGNSAADGIKTLPISAVDSWGNVGMASLEIELKNPAPVLDIVPPDDNFDGMILDPSKWTTDKPIGGIIRQNDELIVTTNNEPATSIARVLSVWRFTGDFDVQVDFEVGEGWSRPATDHLDGAFIGVHIAGQGYQIARLRRSGGSNENVFYAWSSTGEVNDEVPSNIKAGRVRFIRVGTTLAFLYNVEDEWRVLASAVVPMSPAEVYMGNASINASQAFTTYFDNFHINSGLTTYRQ